MSARTLDDWLAWQHGLNEREIDLGLERVRGVWQRLGARRPAPVVITVGGTNGKGSTVALLEAMLGAAGHATGCYTSPHLVRYNERIRLRGKDVADAVLVAVFERIEAARGETALTWFEHGTLAALELMADANLDVALLEVGLGGRLDAVNIIDADAAIVTSIGIDHVEYLGPDRDSIGREKAGISRAGRPAVIGDPDPPRGLLEAARASGAVLLRNGVEFGIETAGGGPVWVARGAAGSERVSLIRDELEAPGRRDNLAASLAALHALRDRLSWRPQVYAEAAVTVHPPARLQRIARDPELLVDVAHNPHAVRSLAAWLRAHPVRGDTWAVYGAMRDKDIAGVAAVLGPCVRQWFCAPLPDAGARGLDAEAVCRRLREGWPAASASAHPDVASALAAARANARPEDRILAFGSFHLAGALLAAAGRASD